MILVYIFIYTIARQGKGDFKNFPKWKENLKMKERKILGSRRKTKDEEMLLDEDLRRGGLRKEISEGMTWDHTFPWTTHGQGVN